MLDVLIVASLRISAVAALVAVILTVMRVRASGVRHAAWTLVLVAMMLMPVLPAIVPPVTVPLPARAEVVLSPAFFLPDAAADGRSLSAERAAPAAVRFGIAPARSLAPERRSARSTWTLQSAATALYLAQPVRKMVLR